MQLPCSCHAAAMQPAVLRNPTRHICHIWTPSNKVTSYPSSISKLTNSYFLNPCTSSNRFYPSLHIHHPSLTRTYQNYQSLGSCERDRPLVLSDRLSLSDIFDLVMHLPQAIHDVRTSLKHGPKRCEALPLRRPAPFGSLRGGPKKRDVQNQGLQSFLAEHSSLNQDTQEH